MTEQNTSSTGDEAEARRRHRLDAAAEHAAAAERARAAETEQARVLVAEFVAEARRRNLPVTTLAARAYDGNGTYRTNRRGWYIKRNRSLGIGEDGAFYVLSVPASLRARFTGATLDPEPPPLVVGKGARDGESMPLAELLRLRLDAGPDFA